MTYIIAEAGTCHEADTRPERRDKACALVHAVAQSGANAVKFQMFGSSGKSFCRMDGDEHRWPRWYRTAIELHDWFMVARDAKTLGIDFLASAFQEHTVLWCKDLGVKYYKVASRAALTYPYHIVPGPFLISEGFGRPEIPPAGANFLHCVPEYPCPLEKARWSGYNAGLSDHSGTIFPGIDAIVRGARFLEVHFAPDGFDAGPDEAVSLDFNALKLLCEVRDGVSAMRQD